MSLTMARSPYSDEQRAQALAVLAEHGVAAAHRETGIPKPTLSRWAHAAGIDLEHSAEQTRAAVAASVLNREHLREQIRTKLLVKADDMLDRMDDEHIDYRGKNADRVTWPKATSGACQQYATAAAILIDKFRLEVGEVTARTEHSDTREAAVQIADELAARRAKQAA